MSNGVWHRDAALSLEAILGELADAGFSGKLKG